MKILREKVLENKIVVVAHRGSSGTAPENTLSSFTQAILAGADMIEADVQITSDLKPVVFHDKFLSRTSDGKGLIKDLTYTEIKNADAGSWFSPDFHGEHIPLLSEVLDLIKDKCYLNIEVKNIEGDNLDERITTIIDTIRDYDYLQNTLFSSFYYNTLYHIKKTYPDIHTAAIRIPRDKRLPSEIAKEIGSEAFVCSLSELTPEVSKNIKRFGIYTGVYSIDTIDELNQVLQHPVKAIVSNLPAMIINELRNNSPVKI